MLVICDEGVNHLVTKIYLQEPGVFAQLFPFLGGFHLTKFALRCAGKFVCGSGVEDLFIECNIFGPKTVEPFMSGSHYYRSFDGLMMLRDALTQLKMKAFWKENSVGNYVAVVEKLDKLRDALLKNSKTDSTVLIDQLVNCNDVKKLMTDIEHFAKKCAESSPQSKYWLNFIRIINTIKDLVRSQRDADFFLNIQTLENLLPVFLECDALVELSTLRIYSSRTSQ